MNPFTDFLPNNYCPKERKVVEEGHCKHDYLAVLEQFTPKVTLAYDEDRCIVASIDELVHPLYTTEDLLRWASMRHKGINPEGLTTNVKGYLGEKLLSLMMESFLKKIIDMMPKGSQADAGVLREKGKAKGRGYAARFDNNWMLRFKFGSSFVLIGKGDAATSNLAYKQEKMGMVYTEIDGMGYLIHNGQKYILAGESSTKKEFGINSWERGSGTTSTSFEERVFGPLKELFPEHQLIYFIMAYTNTLFNALKTPCSLKTGPLDIQAHLKKYNVDTVFIPIPETTPSLHEIADRITGEQIPLIRAAFREQLQMYLREE